MWVEGDDEKRNREDGVLKRATTNPPSAGRNSHCSIPNTIRETASGFTFLNSKQDTIHPVLKEKGEKKKRE